MIRIVFVSTGLSVGGAEISLLNLLQNLDRNRFAPHVVSLTGQGEIGARIEQLGIPVHNLAFSTAPVDSIIALTRLIRRIRPRLVQTWMYHADLIGGFAARVAGVRGVIWGIRNSNLDPVSSSRATVAVAWACARLSGWIPEAIVSCSHAAHTIHHDLGYRSRRFLVIGNGFDLALFRPDPSSRGAVRAELGIPADAPLVAHVARFHPQKNHAGLLKAAGAVHQKRPDVHFMLVGKDVNTENKAIRAAVDDAGIGAVVHLLDGRDDTPRLIAASDVLALSSGSGEAFPRVLGEALACGVPCVATDVGDSRMIVGNCGHIVEPGDDRAFADALLEILSMPPAQRGDLALRARQRAVDCLDIRGVVKQYEALYSDLTEDSACAA